MTEKKENPDVLNEEDLENAAGGLGQLDPGPLNCDCCGQLIIDERGYRLINYYHYMGQNICQSCMMTGRFRIEQ